MFHYTRRKSEEKHHGQMSLWHLCNVTHPDISWYSITNLRDCVFTCELQLPQVPRYYPCSSAEVSQYSLWNTSQTHGDQLANWHSCNVWICSFKYKILYEIDLTGYDDVNYSVPKNVIGLFSKVVSFLYNHIVYSEKNKNIPNQILYLFKTTLLQLVFFEIC